MTDASGVPTNPDLIPTFNTSVDAPSGLGFNTAMAQLQAIITNLKAGTLASGKILPAGIGWTGAYPFVNADVAAAAALAVSKLAPGANGQFMQTTGGVTVWGPGPSSGAVTRLFDGTTANGTFTLIDTNNAAGDRDLIGVQGTGFSIPGNTLGASSTLWLHFSGEYQYNTAAAINQQFKVILGATTAIDSGSSAAWASNLGAIFTPFTLDIFISTLGATNSVYFTARGFSYPGASATTGIGGINTGTATYHFDFNSNGPLTIDMTAAQAIRATWAVATPGTTNGIRIRKVVGLVY